MSVTVRLGWWAVALASLGCSYTASYAPLVRQSVYERLRQEHPARPAGEIDIYLKGSPPPAGKSWIVLGTLEAPTVQWSAMYTSEDLVAAMRRKAAEIGADAIINVRTEQGSTSSGGTGPAQTTFKNLYMWGEAIVFVSPEERARLEAGP